MNNQELEPVEIQGKLVSAGTFLTDRQYLEKRADSELIKIANQELMPYKLYLQQSLKIHIPFILGSLSGIIGMFLTYPSRPLFSVFIATTVISLIAECVISTILPSDTATGDFPIFPILKLYRAKKLFGRAIEELRTEILAEKADITKLNILFHERVQLILDERQGIINNRSSMISKARNSRI